MHILPKKTIIGMLAAIAIMAAMIGTGCGETKDAAALSAGTEAAANESGNGDQDLIERHFDPMEEILQADIFDPIMQVDDVIVPTDGSATVGEIITLLNGSSNADNYTYRMIGKLDGNDDTNNHDGLLLDGMVDAYGEPADFGMVNIEIGSHDYVQINYVNYATDQQKVADCTVVNVFPLAYGKGNCYWGCGFCLDGEGITKDEIVSAYLSGRTEHPRGELLSNNTVIEDSYFVSENSGSRDMDILEVFFPTDLVTPKNVNLTRYYKMAFYQDDGSVSFYKTGVDGVAASNLIWGNTPDSTAADQEDTAAAGEMPIEEASAEGSPADRGNLTEPPAVEAPDETHYEVPDDMKAYQGYVDANGQIIYAEYATDEDCVWAFRNYADVSKKLPVYVKTKNGMVSYDVTWDDSVGHWHLVKRVNGKVTADNYYDNDLIYPVN